MRTHRLCYIQESCPEYESGDNKPPNHHVRSTIPCKKTMADCDMDIKLRLWYGETIACKVKGVNNENRQEISASQRFPEYHASGEATQ